METIVLQSQSRSKINLLLQIAREFGISIVKNKKGKKKSSSNESALLSEHSLSEAWSSSEDERWDKLYKK
jgi:hypothetical protein